jgi:hypothetical protein
METMLRLLRLIPETEETLQASWHERRWDIFVKAWLAVTVGVFALMLAVPFLVVPVALVINVVAYVFGARGLTLSIYGLWDFALPFSAMVALAALVLTVPVMILKELSGDRARHQSKAPPSVPSVSARSPD